MMSIKSSTVESSLKRMSQLWILYSCRPAAGGQLLQWNCNGHRVCFLCSAHDDPVSDEIRLRFKKPRMQINTSRSVFFGQSGLRDSHLQDAHDHLLVQVCERR